MYRPRLWARSGVIRKQKLAARVFAGKRCFSCIRSVNWWGADLDLDLKVA